MWHLSIKKTLHTYWGGGKLPYLRYLTLESFKRLNPGWDIILHTPLMPQKSFAWKSEEQLYGDNYIDCMDRVSELGVTINVINFDKIGFINTASEVHKSDFLRWYLLAKEGGVWSDMDVLFIKPMDDLFFNTPAWAGVNTVFCIADTGHSIGFLMSGGDNKYFGKMLNASLSSYKSDSYQSIGVLLCNKLYPKAEIKEDGVVAVNLPMDVVYAHNSTMVQEIFQPYSPNRITKRTIGIHWYGGHKLSGRYMNATNGGLYSNGRSLIDIQINKIKSLRKYEKPGKVKISIVMAYYNRQSLLDKTLESFDKSSVKDYELIIVDDASVDPLVCDRAKIIRVDKKDKWYNCSCVAWNTGMRAATGNVILLNSPECYHNGDILAYVRDNIRENLYLSFGCYSINRDETDLFLKGEPPVVTDKLVDSTRGGWFNHTLYRPVAYHFCSAMLKKDMDMIGGFDERYAYGVAFDDDEFLRAIRYMGMEVRIIDKPFVIHQFHTHFEFDSYSAWKVPHALNKSIFDAGFDASVHREYGLNKIKFNPLEFKVSISSKPQPQVPATDKKKEKVTRRRDPLLRLLRRCGGA